MAVEALTKIMATTTRTLAVLPNEPESITTPQPTWHDKFVAKTRRRGFNDLHVNHQSCVHGHRESAAVYDRLEKRLGSGFLFILCGPRGGGKTQIATTLSCQELERMAELWKRYQESHWPLYTTAAQLFTEIRSSFDANSQIKEADLIRKFATPHLLTVDESQVRGNTPFEDRTLTDLIDRRYGMQRDTIIVSNLTRAELPAALGPSIISRLHETGEVIECNWKSFRESRK